MEDKELIRIEKRTFIILICVVLLASGLYIFYLSWYESVRTNVSKNDSLNPAKTTYNTMASSVSSFMPAPIVEGKSRSIEEYYSRRNLPGGPPMIPHPSQASSGEANCLACHLNGGYVAKWDRNTPVTPHPQLTACFQCHVEQISVTPAMTRLLLQNLSTIKARAMLGFPPPISHPVEFRDNCIACHGGAAPAEIRTTHPERSNCLQCHVEQKTKDFFMGSGSGEPKEL